MSITRTCVADLLAPLASALTGAPDKALHHRCTLRHATAVVTPQRTGAAMDHLPSGVFTP
jgi:hypothetical protein